MDNMMETTIATSAGWLAGMAASVERQPGTCTLHSCESEAQLRFNGKAVCGGACLERLLKEAVIEEQALATAAAFKARPRVQLGRILIEQGTINEAQLEQALRSQRATGAGRLGCWLKQQVELPEADFTAALSIQWHCPVFRVGTFAPQRMVEYLPRPLVEEHGALPLRVTGTPERLTLCFEDHLDYELMSAVERMHGVGVDAGLLTASEFWQGTRDLLGVSFPRTEVVAAASHDSMISAMSRLLVQAAPVEARLVAVHGCYWLRLWVTPGNGEASGRSRPDKASAARGAVVHDLLCTPQKPRQEIDPGTEPDDIEALAAAMGRVLQAERGSRHS